MYNGGEKNVKIAEFTDHVERVGALSLFGNLLLTGSRDNSIFLYDLRQKRKFVNSYDHHKQEVCGIKWSPNGEYFATGGNDNKLFIFTPKMNIPLFRKTHRAAVKALAWSPLRNNILATGAGTADRCIRVWDVNKKKLLECRDTGS